MKAMIIDNLGFSSHNIAYEFEKRGCGVLVCRNSLELKIFDSIIKDFKPDIIVFSSGPGAPRDAGNVISIIRGYHKKIPMFGIGLGCHCILEAFDGKVSRSTETAHAKQSKISHDSSAIFKGLPNPFKAGRYDSLAASDVPYCFEISARNDKGAVMSIKHKEFPIAGVQFHPESMLTPLGYKIIDNVINELAK